MWHDISIMIGTLIGWHLPGWFFRVYDWLDRKHRARQQQRWDCTLGTVQEQTDKENPR